MKTLACEICDQPVEGETFDDWFQTMRAHWMADHADVMASMADKPKEEGWKWMEAARAKFDAA